MVSDRREGGRLKSRQGLMELDHLSLFHSHAQRVSTNRLVLLHISNRHLSCLHQLAGSWSS